MNGKQTRPVALVIFIAVLLLAIGLVAVSKQTERRAPQGNGVVDANGVAIGWPGTAKGR
jgi:hypothetical protein